MKVFLDVGAHDGETLISVLDPKYDFDMIYVFEPVKKLHVGLNKIATGKKNITLLQWPMERKQRSKNIFTR